MTPTVEGRGAQFNGPVRETFRQELSGSVQRRGRFVKDRVIGLEERFVRERSVLDRAGRQFR
jgi:hypothetical protein